MMMMNSQWRQHKEILLCMNVTFYYSNGNGNNNKMTTKQMTKGYHPTSCCIYSLIVSSRDMQRAIKCLDFDNWRSSNRTTGYCCEPVLNSKWWYSWWWWWTSRSWVIRTADSLARVHPIVNDVCLLLLLLLLLFLSLLAHTHTHTIIRQGFAFFLVSFSFLNTPKDGRDGTDGRAE